MTSLHDRRYLCRPVQSPARDMHLDVLLGTQRYRLRLQGSHHRWVSDADIYAFTADPEAALLFATRHEAFTFMRNLSDEDGTYPLINTVSIEQVSS